ncbi:TetR/AcrR family transcriptional regulator [Mycolicibacterium sp. XJ1819]
MNSRVAAAVDRALDLRQREATEEVERILEAALVVMERVAPAAPRVSDIVEQAGTSNAAFYRYFSGKDDLILAVMERGIGLVASYLEHQMAKESTPLTAVARWIEGTLAQVSDPHLTSMSRAVMTHFTAHKDNEIAAPLRDLLVEQIIAAGCAEPEHAADAVYATVLGTLRRHVEAATQPTQREADYLVSFCLKAIDPDVPASEVARRRAGAATRRRRKSKTNS